MPIQLPKIMQLSIPGLLLLAGAMLGIGACRATIPAGELPTKAHATPSSDASLKGVSGLSGTVLSASDVAGQPDVPLANQLLLAVPASKAGGVLGLEGQELDPARLRFIKAELLRADPSMVITLSDAAGRYNLLLDPGEYVLCVADSEKSPPDFPATTRGCGLTTVLAGQLRCVDISSGFGEIVLVEC